MPTTVSGKLKSLVSAKVRVQKSFFAPYHSRAQMEVLASDEDRFSFLISGKR